MWGNPILSVPLGCFTLDRCKPWAVETAVKRAMTFSCNLNVPIEAPWANRPMHATRMASDMKNSLNGVVLVSLCQLPNAYLPSSASIFPASKQTAKEQGYETAPSNGYSQITKAIEINNGAP